MAITTRQLAQAKDAATALFEQLGLAEYLFDVEPRDGPWQVRIDCAANGGWQSLILDVDPDQLLRIQEDARARDELLERWRRALSSCKVNADQTEWRA